jgi:hypothetical protein
VKVEILGAALEDLCEGRFFYEKQGEGVGEYFLDALFSDSDSLVLYGGIHAEVFGFHRLLARRFPYAIYDKMGDDVAVVFRVLDLRQNPRKTRDALR